MPWEDGIIRKAKISQLKFYIDFYFKMCGGKYTSFLRAYLILSESRINNNNNKNSNKNNLETII